MAGGLWEEVVAEQKGQMPTGMWGKQDSARDLVPVPWWVFRWKGELSPVCSQLILDAGS